MPAARPLSPHLGIYKWQITMVLSILHRVTGLFLCLGALLLTWALIAAASGEAAWMGFAAFCGSWIGLLLLLLWTFALCFHFCNGIRHLFWDAGRGFARDTMQTTGWIVVIASVALTLCIWVWLLFGAHGGAA